MAQDKVAKAAGRTTAARTNAQPDDAARPVAAGADATASETVTRRGPGRPKVTEMPDPVTGLTRRQQAILDVIRDSVERRGYPPSIREICESAGLASTSSVAHQLAMLERKGFLRRDPNRPRAVDVRDTAGTRAKPKRGPPRRRRRRRRPARRDAGLRAGRRAASPPAARSWPSR